jgi:Transglutaminase-like superfamily/Bacterial transglutaminase-like N-terminal region
MSILEVRHSTRYRYANPVMFGEHRMMFRPRESFDQHVLHCAIAITPKPISIRYIHDVFGNCIGIARFDTKASQLEFESVVRLEHLPELSLDHSTSPDGGINSYPFAYVVSDLPDVHSSMLRLFEDPDHILSRWSHRFLQNLPKIDAIHVLTNMTHAIHDELEYVSRRTGRPQSPVETLRLGKGTCRDFAVLMMEGTRSLGLACRFVSGYLHIPPKDATSEPMLGGGNTHAWVRVFLPNGGWAEFDPTTGLVGNKDLIRVAVVRDPIQATPLWGTWEGNSGDYLGMDVTVNVTAV